jgi:hypothetical protein
MIYLYKIHVILQFVLNNTCHISLDLDDRCTCNLGFGCAHACGLGRMSTYIGMMAKTPIFLGYYKHYKYSILD